MIWSRRPLREANACGPGFTAVSGLAHLKTKTQADFQADEGYTGTSKLRFRLDAAKSPKQLDLTADFGGGELTTPGIYKIEGDTHTLCLPTSLGGVRPKEFKSVEGVTLMVFKRAEKK